MKQHPIKIASLGMQHMLAMYAGAIIVPLIVGGGLGLNQKELTYLVSIDLLMCGVATILQALSNRFFGIGLPVVLGCTFTAVGPMIAIGKQYGVSSIYGAIIAAVIRCYFCEIIWKACKAVSTCCNRICRYRN